MTRRTDCTGSRPSGRPRRRRQGRRAVPPLEEESRQTAATHARTTGMGDRACASALQCPCGGSPGAAAGRPDRPPKPGTGCPMRRACAQGLFDATADAALGRRMPSASERGCCGAGRAPPASCLPRCPAIGASLPISARTRHPGRAPPLPAGSRQMPGVQVLHSAPKTQPPLPRAAARSPLCRPQPRQNPVPSRPHFRSLTYVDPRVIHPARSVSLAALHASESWWRTAHSQPRATCGRW